ncbi:MAG: hypothetical protein WBM59_02955, partial [Sedimenticolaceae bacterium]
GYVPHHHNVTTPAHSDSPLTSRFGSDFQTTISSVMALGFILLKSRCSRWVKSSAKAIVTRAGITMAAGVQASFILFTLISGSFVLDVRVLEAG